MSVSEPLKKCRKIRDDVKTGACPYPRISPGGACLLPGRRPALRWHDPASGCCMERGNLSFR